MHVYFIRNFETFGSIHHEDFYKNYATLGRYEAVTWENYTFCFDSDKYQTLALTL
jgi:hypothetical protein